MPVVKDVNQVKYRRLIFSVTDNFLSTNNSLDSDINYFIQCPVNIQDSLDEFHTLLIDLSQTKKTIWSGIYHRTRSEISSFTQNQIFEHQIIYDISPKELGFYITLFDHFASFKNIRRAEKSRLMAYNQQGILAISFIKQHGELLSVNFYRLTMSRATNLHSFNLKPQLNKQFNNSHIGRAHRSLHWLDILKFRELGVNFYDFCGCYNGSTDKNLLNINKFKEQFTSYKVLEYTGVIYRNKFLKLLLKLRR